MIALSMPTILDAAHAELMRRYGRHQADALWTGIRAAIDAHVERVGDLTAAFTPQPEPIALERAS